MATPTPPTDPDRTARILGYAGVVLIAGAFAILLGPAESVDPLVAAGALLLVGAALLGVQLWRR